MRRFFAFKGANHIFHQNRKSLGADETLLSARLPCGRRALSKFYGQADRAISTRQLRELPLFHSEPIKQVVFLRPLHHYWWGDLILRSTSRLYAFSVYYNRTSLPSRAIDMTAGTQEVRPSRSSRTKDRPSQISYAHTR
jgi:hypothetical protein